MRFLPFLIAVCGACHAGAQAQTVSRQAPLSAMTMSELLWPGVGGGVSLGLINEDRSASGVLLEYADPLVERQVRNFALDRRPRPATPAFQDVNVDNRHRAWGVSVGFKAGPVALRLAHQNKHVSNVTPDMALGNLMDAKNSILAANVQVGRAKVYAAYGVNRGWGSSPLWNPDNPYSVALAAMPSTNSRDLMTGVAIPFGHVTVLASFIRKNDLDLANRDADQLAFGLSRTLSRRTDVYASYSYTRVLSGAGFAAGSGMAPGSGVSSINIGMRHNF